MGLIATTKKYMTFVGRDIELERLNEFLRKMLNYETQVCFIAGEAGTGKTSLITEFIKNSEHRNENLLFTIGQCNDQFGVGDSYLPFRNILGKLIDENSSSIPSKEVGTDSNNIWGRLVRRVRRNSAPANTSLASKKVERTSKILKTLGRGLVEIAPDLIGTLIPGVQITNMVVTLALMGAKERGLLEGLEERAIASTNKPDDFKEDTLIRQYTALLQNLSKEYPLVIILDDLQWVDIASQTLLFHLARELKECRILLVGLYRSNDLEVGRNGQPHPLKTTLNEIKRIYGDICIDLDNLTEINRREFVEKFVNKEPNKLSSKFVDDFFQKTGGNALFTTELWRVMTEKGALIQDTDGQWQESSQLNWDQLPARVEAIIEDRINRLTKELRDILDIACIEGPEFTAQVVSTVRKIKERNLIQKLSRELHRCHQLIQEGGNFKVGRTNLLRYTFSHSLFHTYLYNTLEPGERQILHEEVAQVLEALYAGQTEMIAVQLVRHYTESENSEKVVHYLQIAGEQACKLGNFTQARDFFTQLLAKIEVNETVKTNINRANLMWWIAETYYCTGRYELAETEYGKSIEAAQQFGDQECKVRGLIGRANSLRKQRRYEDGLPIVQEALEIAQQIGERALESQALRVTGIFYGQKDETDKRRTCCEEALAIAQEIGDVANQMACLNNLGVLFGNTLGDYKKAHEFYKQALDLGFQQKRLTGQTIYLRNLANSSYKLGDYITAKHFIKESLGIRNQIGNVSETAGCFYTKGVIKLLSCNDTLGALKDLENSFAIAQKHNNTNAQGMSRNYLIITDLMQDLVEEAKCRSHDTKDLNYKGKTTVVTTTILEGIIYLRLGDFPKAQELFEGAISDAEKLLPSKRWTCRYHRAFAQAGITLLLSSPESRSDALVQATDYFQEAVEICGWVGILDQALLILREMRKADHDDLLQSIEEQLVHQREIAWNNRPFTD